MKYAHKNLKRRNIQPKNINAPGMIGKHFKMKTILKFLVDTCVLYGRVEVVILLFLAFGWANDSRPALNSRFPSSFNLKTSMSKGYSIYIFILVVYSRLFVSLIINIYILHLDFFNLIS